MKIFLQMMLISLNVWAGVFDFTSIQSNFTQTITNEENKQIIYEGSFYARADSKALWIYKKPIDKKIYFNQNQVVIVEPELEQAIVTTLEKNPNLASILQSAKEISKGLYEAFFDDIRYEIQTKNNEIEQISYKDKLENRVVIKLENQTINAFLDDVLFEPNVPKDYDIIMQ